MRKDPIGTLFPNVNTSAGSYSPTAFCITLNLTTTRQLRDIKPNQTDFLMQRRLLYHEMRHHIDHLSTLWGQEKIEHLYEAVNAKLLNKEAAFPAIIRYKLEEKQFHYDDYFTEQYNRVPYRSIGDRWIWQLSSGVRFDYLGELQRDKPILFIKFGTTDGKSVNRVPLSIASLLETNAMYEETVIEQNYLNNLPEERQNKERIKLDVIFTRDILYNQDLAVYNAAVHLLANNLRISDDNQAFRIASSIATVALNLPSSLLAQIPIDKEYMAVWEDRPDFFIANHDYGFLFFTLVRNYGKVFDAAKGYNLADLLACNNLPRQTEIEEMVVDQMDRNLTVIRSGTFFHEFFSDHLKAGKVLFKMRGLDGLGQVLTDTILSGHYAPFIVTKDAAFAANVNYAEIMIRQDVPENIPITDWYHLAGELSQKMEEFYSVRGL